MKRERQLQNLTIIVMAVALLSLSVSFAAYEHKNNRSLFSKWDVHLDVASFKELTNIKANSKDVNDTGVSYSVNLPGPGSSYSFQVNAKNNGTINAKLVKITLSGLTESQKKLIKYKVKYGNYEYEETTDNLSVELPAGQNEIPIIVTVEYMKSDDIVKYQEEELNLTVTLDYKDASI